MYCNHNIVKFSDMSEKHILKITVEIKVVKLTVRFPCKLAFELRTGTNLFSQTKSNKNQKLIMTSSEENVNLEKRLKFKWKACIIVA